MHSLDEAFDQFVQRLREPRTMAAGGGDPFFYLPYEPGQIFELRQLLPGWEGRLRNAGYYPVRLSFSELLWELIDETGYWEEWVEIEAQGEVEPAQLNAAMRTALAQNEALVERVANAITHAGASNVQGPSVVLLTDTEALHPFFRVRGLESRLHDRIIVPTLILYPGRRVGQYGLRFLDLFPEDSNYRATIIGDPS